jgi:hypothetical protein
LGGENIFLAKGEIKTLNHLRGNASRLFNYQRMRALVLLEIVNKTKWFHAGRGL